jgi:hypothetical protein
MNKTKVKRFLEFKYFLSVFIVILYLSYKNWIYVNVYYLDFLPLFVSAILILIDNRWLYRILILLNVFILSGQLNYIIGRCFENFPTNTFTNSYHWLIDMPAFHWSLAFWVLQISLVIYLIAVENKFYRNRNSLG